MFAEGIRGLWGENYSSSGPFSKHLNEADKMKITIAPDSFKGCLSAVEVCEAIAAGVQAIDPAIHCEKVPMADGGEGTVEALVQATKGQMRRQRVTGPLGDPVEAQWGLLGDGETAVIEMAAASGLALVPPERRNPLHTTTYGTGELIKAALEAEVRTIIIGIGGSATNDAGLGMAAALGGQFWDDKGQEISPTGAGLLRLAKMSLAGLDPRLRKTQIRVACDVSNPLYGPQGAAYVYAPQKGATPEIVARLDDGLKRFARIVQRDLGLNVSDLPGAGAAGGLGAGLVAFCNARLEPGVQIVMEAVRLKERLAGSCLCLTGEGRLDTQTAYGKAPQGVSQIAASLGIPCIAIGGSVALDAALNEMFAAVFSLCNEPLSLEQAMEPQAAKRRLAFVAQQVLRCFLAGARRHNIIQKRSQCG